MFTAQKEFTWGGELSETNEEINWNPLEEEEEEDEDFIYNHCLFLKQAVLGDKAKEGERNIIEVETMNWNNKKIQQPIVSLKLGLHESCALDLTLLPPTKLRLKCGSGPVHLTGTHAMEMEEDEEYTIGDSTADDLSMGTTPDQKPRKRPASARRSGAKKIKMEENGTDEDEDEEEESAEDEEEATTEEEEEEEEDEDEEDEDEDEEDESMEEDGEEDSSPEKTKKKTKKGKQNGNAENGTAKKKGKKAKGKKITLEEIKKELTKGVIKKEDKFNTMIKSKYSLNDAKKLADLWSWYKAK